MPVIEYQQFIKAPVELCFDIKRSVDIHTKTTAKTKEIAVDGVTEGLLMIDKFQYKSPFGPVGVLADKLFLEKYMRAFIISRAKALKKIAENML
ncbi:hypothetical protein P4646_19150 [Peribacillus simplex]|uniref:hypothetical protein n=1 Tax=Peribacillus simplex TaxID=1478 RepID=UPI002E2004B7|nr:hypothetical protein [Peribacillus simplex]